MGTSFAIPNSVPKIWTDQYLNDLATEAEIQISTEVPCIYVRFGVSVVLGQTIYSFADPTFCNPTQRLTGIIRITYQSWTVHPVFQQQLRNMVVPFKPEEGEIKSSRPFMWMRQGYGLDGIKIYPAPASSITYDNSDVTTQTSIKNNVIVSGWRIADPTGTTYRIPDWIRETLVRYYVMERAYKKEGKGQNLDAAKYYGDQYAILLGRFKKLVEKLFASRTHGFTDTAQMLFGYKPPHPRLPPNFGTIITGLGES